MERIIIKGKLNITSTILDKLGFSEYWDEHGTWGGRTLTFGNGTMFRIVEQCEMDDDEEGYGNGKYVANHYYFSGWFAIPNKDASCHYDLFFIDEMCYCIEKEYPECLSEFINKCKKLNMEYYLPEHLIKK